MPPCGPTHGAVSLQHPCVLGPGVYALQTPPEHQCQATAPVPAASYRHSAAPSHAAPHHETMSSAETGVRFINILPDTLLSSALFP